MCVKQNKNKKQKNGFDGNVILLPQLDLQLERKILGEPQWLIVQYTEKLFMSQIGASTVKMCQMKNATYGKERVSCAR